MNGGPGLRPHAAIRSIARHPHAVRDAAKEAGTARCGLALALALSLCAALIGCEGGRTDARYTAATGGDPARGKTAIRQFACGSCHRIPGIRTANGVVAPPLDFFSRRSFIAGELPNNTDNLVRWLRNPPGVEPGTAMPVLGLTEQQARDIAAYLYTLS